MELIILAAIVVGIPILLLGLPSPFAAVPRLHLPEGFDGWPARVKAWHVGLLVVLALLLLLAINGPHHREDSMLMLAGGFVILTLFLRAWQHEFLFLMGRRDDEFPGRHDKLVWVLMLTAFAPVGIWFFRSYHLAHWPEPEPKPRPDHARTAPEAL